MTKSPTATNTALVEKTNTALVAPSDEDVSLFATLSGEGNENITSADVAIPRLLLLQSMSPQVKRTEAAYVEGAQEGMFINTLTNELLGESATIIDCHYLAVEAEWIPRAKGGGFRGAHAVGSPITISAKEDPERRGRMVLPNGNDLVRTAQHFVLVQSPVTGSWTQCLLALTGTQLKHGRRLNALLSNIILRDSAGNVLKGTGGNALTAPRFAVVIKLSTRTERNDQGSWFVISPEVARWVTRDELIEAKIFRDSIARGEVKVDLGADVGENAVGSTIDGTAERPVDSDEIPF